MKILLAGYNIDTETIRELRQFIQRIADNLEPERFSHSDPVIKEKILEQLHQEALQLLQRDNLTPETISAAYARISRNPLPVNELREIARQEVDRARKSNQNIIFGLGHSSVAEHANFNFDILGVSRLAVESIEHFRLASYTEKSQRYILFKDDFIIPKEIRGSTLENEYTGLIREQNAAYQKLYKILQPYFFETYPDAAKEPKGGQRRLEGLAKEDARYLISLATETQLGMTLNARSLENMISKLNSHPLAEVREIGRQLFNVSKVIAPSIIKYVEPTDYLSKKREKALNFISLNIRQNTEPSATGTPQARLIDYTRDADERILAAVLFKYEKLEYSQALREIKQMDDYQQKEFFRVIYRDMNAWDSVLREFEFVTFTFELIISASNYGQLKRHRMANIDIQDYDISLGVTIPDSVKQTGQEKLFLNIIDQTNQVYEKLYLQYPVIAPYVLTNSHRRRVLLNINLRELYHFTRLREDEHAQWDIREICSKMHHLVTKQLPLAGALLCGKDNFNRVYQNFYKE
ncbi:MAG: FAD-dependent thymidylate synthase [Calditrichia bacterium]